MSKTILIVDDEPSIVVPLQFLMEKNNYRVLVAKSGEQAMKLIASGRPDLVLLDVMLPGVSGFDVCRYIRQNPDFKQTRVIMLTAMGHRVNVAKGLALGADAYITKPFANKEIVSRVKQLLDNTDETEQ